MSSATLMISATASVTKAGDLGGSFSGTMAVQAGTGGTVTLTGSDITKVFGDERSGSSADVLTLNDGSLTDAYGAALTYAATKSVWIKNTHATASLAVGGGSNPLFGTDLYTVKAGQVLPITSPFTVDSSHKQITITPSAAATYSVLILGT